MGFLSEYEDFGLDSDDLRFVWTFDSGSAYIPDTIPNGNGRGIFENGPNPTFWDVGGTSKWSGDRVRVEGSNGLPTWELFMVFDRNDLINSLDIMASTRTTLEGKGFSFGITQSNQPFIYTNFEGETNMLVFNSLKMSAQNTICLSKGRDAVTLTLYRPSGGYTESETVTIKNGALHNGEVFLGADIFLSGEIPNSTFVGRMHECAMSEEGILGDTRKTLLHRGYSGFESGSLVEGLVSSENLLGCTFMNMSSFEYANKICGFSSASKSFYVDEREGLNNASVFADGIVDPSATISTNGAVSFSVAEPSGGIYDIFTVGGNLTPPIPPVSKSITFAESKQTNSFYGTAGGRRLIKNQEYFDASSFDLFFEKGLGGIAPKSNNILCQK